jgi:hypothetical protein
MGQYWWVLVVLFALGGFFFSVGCTLVRRTRALRRHGAKAYGRVIGLTSDGDKDRPVVRWTTADGRDVQATAPIGKTWTTFRPGRAVLVHYDPHRPERMVIEGYSSGSEWVFCIIGAVLLAVLAVVLVRTAL